MIHRETKRLGILIYMHWTTDDNFRSRFFSHTLLLVCTSSRYFWILLERNLENVSTEKRLKVIISVSFRFLLLSSVSLSLSLCVSFVLLAYSLFFCHFGFARHLRKWNERASSRWNRCGVSSEKWQDVQFWFGRTFLLSLPQSFHTRWIWYLSMWFFDWYVCRTYLWIVLFFAVFFFVCRQILFCSFIL